MLRKYKRIREKSGSSVNAGDNQGSTMESV